jgi:hypothetical protein
MAQNIIMRRPLRIGITIGLGTEDESLWINGIKQNAIFLAKLFQNSVYRHHVTLLNTTDVAVTNKLGSEPISDRFVRGGEGRSRYSDRTGRAD